MLNYQRVNRWSYNYEINDSKGLPEKIEELFPGCCSHMFSITGRHLWLMDIPNYGFVHNSK